MKKGFYFISMSLEDKEGKRFNGVDLEEGSFEYKGEVFIHRSSYSKNNQYGWKVSHTDSGANITAGKSLPEARRIADKLQGFSIWKLRTYDEIKKAITMDDYSSDVKQIRSIISH